MYSVLFFFFKQKTAYEMRISDWSSDVCSSDLLKAVLAHRPERVGGMVAPAGRLGAVAVTAQIRGYHRVALGQRGRHPMPAHVGQRVAVQQQQRRPIAADRGVDLRARGLDRSQERRVGNEWVRTCSSRGSL